MYSTYESSIKEIIGIDGVLSDYEEFVEPDDPPENAGMVAIETASKKYAANVELHKKDCAKLYGVILGQMSDASITRVNEMPAGKRVIEDCAVFFM